MRPVDFLELGGVRRTPLVQQSEASECGLACLAMVAGYHGIRTDMPTLRRRFGLSLKGTTLKALMQVAEQIGFAVRPLRGEIASLEALALPAVLHWDMSHFVVLTRISRGLRGRRYHVHDPARGALVLREEDLSRHFTGVIVELLKSERFQPRREASRLKISQLWSKMSGLWPALRQVLLLSIVLQLAALETPFYLQLAVDTAFPSFDSDLLKMLAIGFGGLVLINMLTGWLRSLILVSLGNSLSYQVVVNLYRHLVRLPLPWFEKRHVGDIISRFGSTKPIADLLSQGLIAAIIDGAMAVLTLGLMLIYSPLLALVAVVAWGLFAALKIGFLHSLRTSNLNAITAAARENSAFIESIRGISALKSFGQEGNRQRIWQQLKADSVNAEVKLGRLSAGFDAGGQFILGVERILFVYLAITMAMSGGFTVGMIFAFQAYKQQFLDASTRLIEQAVRYRLLDLHLHRIADIALSKSEHRLEGLGDFVQRLSTDIELQDLCFRYGAGEPEILKNVNLTVAAGEMIAFTGPSGGGKTTLLKLMMGLYEPTGGKLVIGGKPMERGHLPSWRKRIASVAQDDMLFAGSLAENIAFFDPEIDMAAVERAARLAAIHQDISAMPLGYETLVGDMGSALSGGQKQRVLLARALYAEPDILFVDEGTAHLDAQSEAAVMAALADLKITRIFVAHRSRAIAAADRIYVVRNGTAIPSPELRPADREAAVPAE